MNWKNKLRRMPVIGSTVRKILKFIKGKPDFRSSKSYWEKRYRKGGDSGAGSYNRLAKYKADVINSFISEKSIGSVIEFGCGDGNQLQYFEVDKYLGFDVSESAVNRCKELYKTDESKNFKILSNYHDEQAELTMSLDVIYHLVEESVFESHLKMIFEASNNYVIIYSSNQDNHENNGISPHVKHRNFTNWVENNRSDFKLLKMVPNKYPFDGDGERSSYADFYFFEKII